MSTVTLQTGLRRLTRLANYLDKADALHIKKKEPLYDQQKFQHHAFTPDGAPSCKTPACALGHWGFIAPRGANLRWDKKRGLLDGDEGATSFTFVWSAAADFGIQRFEARELFDLRGCGGAQTGKEAAAYIRGFVARKRAEPKKEASRAQA